MSKIKVIACTAALAAASMVLTACEPKPGVAQNPAAAAAAEQTPAQSEPAKPAFAIFAAQMGKALNDQGQLAEAVAEVSAADPIYGMAIFRGTSPGESRVSLKVADASGSEVFTEEKTFTASGETPVMFTVRAIDGTEWKAGEYKATYLCDGAPCWEIPFKVQ